MNKFFNTAGPVNKAKHYKIDPLSRLDVEEIEIMIDQEKYFIMYAPRQTGKTSCLLALQDYLNEKGEYYCLYINVEAAQACRNDFITAQKVIIQEIKEKLEQSSFQFKNNGVSDPKSTYGTDYFGQFLARLCRSLDKPLILLIDEIDSLIGDSLISILRQLRAGYTSRPGSFPQSIILCGVRDIKDY